MLRCGSGQRGIQADAANPDVAAREGRGADGEEHHDAQSYPRAPGEQPCLGKVGDGSLNGLLGPAFGRGRVRRGTEGCHLSFRLLPHIRGNVGFVFTKEDLTEIRDMLLANKVGE